MDTHDPYTADNDAPLETMLSHEDGEQQDDGDSPEEQRLLLDD